MAVVHNIHVVLPFFGENGRGDMDPTRYMDHVAQIARLRTWDEATTIEEVGLALKGKAAQWFEDTQTSFRARAAVTMANFRADFLRRFAFAKTGVVKILPEFDDLRQRSQEQVEEFAQRIRLFVNKWFIIGRQAHVLEPVAGEATTQFLCGPPPVVAAPAEGDPPNPMVAFRTAAANCGEARTLVATRMIEEGAARSVDWAMRSMFVSGLKVELRQKVIQTAYELMPFNDIVDAAAKLQYYRPNGNGNGHGNGRVASAEDDDDTAAAVQRGKANGRKREKVDPKKATCHFCKRIGHFQTECRKRIMARKECLDGKGKPFAPGSYVDKLAKKAEQEYWAGQRKTQTATAEAGEPADHERNADAWGFSCATIGETDDHAFPQQPHFLAESM